MPYITADYYENEFKGVMPLNPEDLDKYISRASDVIDMLTGYRLVTAKVDIDSDKFSPFIRDQVKKATAYQVQYFVLQGGDTDVMSGNTDVSSASIGSFSYSDGSSSGLLSMSNPATLQMLVPTGLLYRAVGVIH